MRKVLASISVMAIVATAAWIMWGGPRNGEGSGAPSTVFGLLP